MLKKLQNEGGFPPGEPYDSVKRINPGAAPAPPYQVCSYAWALAAVGEWERAEAVARSIDEEDERGQGLAILSQRLAEAGLLDKAEALALSIPADPQHSGALVEKVTALIQIAARRAQNGEAEKAAAVLHEAEAGIRLRVRADYLQSGLLDEMAQVWVKLGKPENASSLWEEAISVARNSIEAYHAGGVPDVDTSKVLAGIARHAAASGSYEQARKAAQIITDNSLRERVLGIITEIERGGEAKN